MITTLNFTPFNSIPINGTLYQTKTTTKIPIVYLHGGGLMFGTRDDLPQAYLEVFLQAGHPVITLDYLLSPEVKLTTSLKVLIQTLDQLDLGSDYILFGRSAGAFLSSLLLKSGQTPQAFISFYGYYHLDYPEFNRPAPFYTKFPRVAPLEAATLIQKQPITTGTMNDRYPLYLSARQFGTWLSYFLDDQKQAPDFRLSQADFNSFPKTFLVHCKQDPDVPFYATTAAAEMIPNNHLLTIEQVEHDFDRTVSTKSLEIYQQALKFIQ